MESISAALHVNTPVRNSNLALLLYSPELYDAKALQECTQSGVIQVEANWMESRTQRRSSIKKMNF
jgi:hypothetical protein